MIASFIASFIQFFNAITVLFSAFGKSAQALDHLAGWAEESAGAVADEAANERKAKQLAMKETAAVTAKASKAAAKAD